MYDIRTNYEILVLTIIQLYVSHRINWKIRLFNEILKYTNYYIFYTKKTNMSLTSSLNFKELLGFAAMKTQLCNRFVISFGLVI